MVSYLAESDYRTLSDFQTIYLHHGLGFEIATDLLIFDL